MHPLFRTVAHDVGLVLLVPAGLALTGLAVALHTGEHGAALGFGMAAVGGGGIGGALAYGFRSERSQSALLGRRSHAPPITALAWLLAAVIAAVPFGVAGVVDASPATQIFADPVNALFESMSGLTSTGLTVSSDASTLPSSLQWWRSILQWVGGIGILYFALALAPSEHDGTHRPELDEEMSARASSTHLLAIWGIYIAYTGVALLAFWSLGMPLWEAINHAMTGIATGGFTVTADSFASYSPAIHLVGSVVMLLGAVSFGVHYAVLLRGRFRQIARDRQNRLMAALLLGGVIVLALAVGLASREVPFADVAFQWTSALLTAGFSTSDVSVWGTLPLLILIIGMFIGGASGSTAGGLKQGRTAALLRGLTHANTSGRVRLALRQLLRLITTLAVGTVLLVFLGGVGWLDALFEATSALGTVGLSTGVTGHDLPAGGRLVLTGLMWIGRLEVAAVLALLAWPTQKRSPRDPAAHG